MNKKNINPHLAQPVERMLTGQLPNALIGRSEITCSYTVGGNLSRFPPYLERIPGANERLIESYGSMPVGYSPLYTAKTPVSHYSHEGSIQVHPVPDSYGNVPTGYSPLYMAPNPY